MTEKPDVQMVAVDGRDALAYVIIRPGDDAARPVAEASARGITKRAAAHLLRQIADMWDAETTK
ncbi:hypothetical protein [Streptomyces sp. NPDC058045]|uniref:hypothetical protein n=1 Tax=Streptomyces sp. NPDC058045 TaxID=3346311 RepID=UPI0036E39357